MAINPSNFVSVINNPFFALAPGTTHFYESPDGTETATFAVTRKTKTILGVKCIVVEHIAYVDGVVHEIALDYFAQHQDGSVWYFGESVRNFEDGRFVDRDGSWLAGVNGAEPGIIMQASPQAGTPVYNQENAPGIAEDQAQVISTAAPVNVPYGSFVAVQTSEFSPLNPGVLEQKYYVAGVGEVLAVNAITGEQEHLVKIRIDGTSGNDTLLGKAGPDELYGGVGNDTLGGGNDLAVDRLFGGQGGDTISVGTADQAFGEGGNDLLRLFDNVGFGSIDGGGQYGGNLAYSVGDVLQFDGTLNLTAAGLSERIAGIEALSMKDGSGGDALSLSAQDVLDLGDGTFNPLILGGDDFDKGGAVRVDGDLGDQLSLAGGNWTEIDARNAPDGFVVFASQGPAGDAYVLVQEDIAVSGLV